MDLGYRYLLYNKNHKLVTLLSNILTLIEYDYKKK